MASLYDMPAPGRGPFAFDDIFDPEWWGAR